MAELREIVLVHFPACLRGMPVVAAPGRNHIMCAPETAGRTLFVNKEHGVVFVGGVIHGDGQVPPLTDNPFMGAAILMNHHPG